MTMIDTPHDPSLAELLTRLSQQTSQLVRDEVRLAQLELGQKAKKGGIGAALIGTGGLVAVYGVGALVAAAIFALDLVLPGWAAALCVAGALFLLSGVAALLGVRTAKKASPPVPEKAVASVKADLAALKR
jgi:uncharacterized membrane protein YqjE